MSQLETRILDNGQNELEKSKGGECEMNNIFDCTKYDFSMFQRNVMKRLILVLCIMFFEVVFADAQKDYEEGVNLCGGKMFDSLILAINNIPDVVITKKGHDAKLQAIADIENIGPIHYYRPQKTIVTRSYEKVGDMVGVGTDQWGSFDVRGDVYGWTTHERIKTLNYVVETVPTFSKGVDLLKNATRAKHLDASLELATVIFCEGLKGVMGMDDRKMYQLFKSASQQNSRAMLMQAFCTYYGIGTSQNKNKAKAICQKLIEGGDFNEGWCLRRANETNKK